jgi:hypothetical protein
LTTKGTKNTKAQKEFSQGQFRLLDPFSQGQFRWLDPRIVLWYRKCVFTGSGFTGSGFCAFCA